MAYNSGNTGYGGSGFSGRPQFRIGPGKWGSAIKWLIISNVIVFFIQFGFAPGGFERMFGLTPALFYTEFPNRILQPFTYMFLHGSLGHIFFNMFVLWMFGVEIERMWGAGRFLKFYLLAGLTGALFSLIFTYNSPIPIIGASGAVFGILAAYWRYFPERYLYLYFLLPVKVKYVIPALLILPMLFESFGSGGNIAHLAHLGGAVYGFFAARKMSAGVGSPGLFEKLRVWRRKKTHDRLSAKMEDNRRQAEDVMRRVDAILDKINDVGLENISEEERRFLEEASEQLSRDRRRH